MLWFTIIVRNVVSARQRGEISLEMAKVTSKGQITIPVSIRRRLRINEGDKLLFIDNPDGVVMVNPDMLPAGQDIDTLRAGEVSPRPSAEPASRAGAASPVRQHISAPGKTAGTTDTNGKTAPRVNGLDVGALLDEIRSIGSKI